MSQHIYKEFRFYSEDCTQEFKCKNCGNTTRIPAAMKPSDYAQDLCKKGNDNVYRTDPSEMSTMQQRNSLQALNRHDRRRQNVQGV